MTMTPLGPQNDVISLNNMPVITYSVTNFKKRHMFNSKHAHIRLTYVGKVHIVPCKCLHMTHTFTRMSPNTGRNMYILTHPEHILPLALK